MPKVDPRDFLLNTDYEMDKIIYFTEGTVDNQQTLNIPHNLGFAPLVFGVGAFTSDFSDPRNLPFTESTSDNTIGCTLDASSTKIQLIFTDYSSAKPKIYFRVYGFEPTGSHAKIGATSKYSRQFILNTDYNYCKLYKTGVTTPNTTITHNLGYLPQVLAWRETSNGLVSPIEYSGVGNAVIVTDTTVIFNYRGASKIHYRIYYDEA